MSFRNLAWCGGRLTRFPYWLLLISLVVTFFISAIAFPAFVLIILPCSYLATCWLANRLRDAGWPAFLAIGPAFITVGLVLLQIVASISSLGLRQQAQTTTMYALWLIGSIFVIAGLFPSSLRSPQHDS